MLRSLPATFHSLPRQHAPSVLYLVHRSESGGANTGYRKVSKSRSHCRSPRDIRFEIVSQHSPRYLDPSQTRTLEYEHRSGRTYRPHTSCEAGSCGAMSGYSLHNRTSRIRAVQPSPSVPPRSEAEYSTIPESARIRAPGSPREMISAYARLCQVLWRYLSNVFFVNESRFNLNAAPGYSQTYSWSSRPSSFTC